MHHGEAQDCVELLRVLAVYHPPLIDPTVRRRGCCTRAFRSTLS
jgi:hypothetical protein